MTFIANLGLCQTWKLNYNKCAVHKKKFTMVRTDDARGFRHPQGWGGRPSPMGKGSTNHHRHHRRDSLPCIHVAGAECPDTCTNTSLDMAANTFLDKATLYQLTSNIGVMPCDVGGPQPGS